jgi:CBS-domain-containing membrane protein
VPVRARDVLTRDPATVTPGTSVKAAAQILVDRGFAAAPVVDRDDRLVGIVSEADVLRDRVPPDPRLRLRRPADDGSAAPPVHVRGVMTTDVRTADADADVADVARLLVESYEGHLDGGDVTVREGVATVRRNRALADAEEGVLRVLVRTVRGLVGMRVLPSC